MKYFQLIKFKKIKKKYQIGVIMIKQQIGFLDQLEIKNLFKAVLMNNLKVNKDKHLLI